MSLIEIVLLALTIASLALHAFAPKTKNTYDDAAAEVVDAVKSGIAAKAASDSAPASQP